MHTTHKRAKLQQSLTQKFRQETTPHTFFNLLTNAELLSVVEDSLPEFRERRFPPTETLSMFLAQAIRTKGSSMNGTYLREISCYVVIARNEAIS